MNNQTSRRKYNVLVLDDEQLILMTVSACLRDTQYQVTIADHAEKALEIFRRRRFDAIITDIMMDSIDGFKFREMVRNYNSRIPIIFFTSLIDDINSSLIQRIMNDNYSYYMNKNFSRKMLLEKLDQAIMSYQAQNEIIQLNQRMEKDLELAMQVQQSVLPPWMHFDDQYEFSYIYKPFFKISGDLFEWFPLDADRCLMVFGDISGHGIHSALTMVAVQSVLKQLLTADTKHMLQPHLILQQLNAYFCERLNGCAYMTCLVSIWNFKEDTVLFHNAGHPDMLCFHTLNGGTVDVNIHKKGSLPVGMMPGAEYLEDNNVLFRFCEDNMFLIFSDGVFDLHNEDSKSAEVNMDLVMQLAPVVAQDNCTIHAPFRLCSTLEQIGFTTAMDDLAMLVLKKTPRRTAKLPEFRRTMFPDLVSIDQANMEAVAFVTENFKSVELAARVELLLSEFLVNIVKHGLENCKKNSEAIALHITGDDRQLHITVWDRGKVWNAYDLKSEESLDKLLIQLSTEQKQSGRGIPLILKISPQIVRHHYSGLNETLFTIQIPEGGNHEQRD